MRIDLHAQTNKSRQLKIKVPPQINYDGYRLGSVPACFNSAPLV
jgi:hypothetical protein